MAETKFPDYIDPKSVFGSERMPAVDKREGIVKPPAINEQGRIDFNMKIAARKSAYGHLPALPKTRNYRQVRGK